jgi:hypothetical protein
MPKTGELYKTIEKKDYLACKSETWYLNPGEVLMADGITMTAVHARGEIPW